jgi:hypothetical protein
MSCRANDGNSAATSLAHFLTGADERTGSHIFHVLRKSAATHYGDEAKLPADIEAVRSFLADARSIAHHDSRIPDARRSSLLKRIDGAETKLDQGQDIPTKATFDAWQQLRARLDEVQLSSGDDVDQLDPTTGITAEGITISKQEVVIAYNDFKRLSKMLHTSLTIPRESVTISHRLKESQKMVSLEVSLADDKRHRLAKAYDSTDIGYELLLAEKSSAPGSRSHRKWLSRKASAEENRTKQSLLTLSLSEAEETGYEEASKILAGARALLETTKGAYDANPIPRTQYPYDQARVAQKKARRIYLYTLLERPEVTKVIKSADLSSTQTWASLSGDETISRNEIWSAVDLYARDLDAVRVDIGKIREAEVARFSLYRAEARQSLLDSEGNGAIDLINPRYAELVKRKRGSLTGVT